MRWGLAAALVWVNAYVAREMFRSSPVAGVVYCLAPVVVFWTVSRLAGNGAAFFAGLGYSLLPGVSRVASTLASPLWMLAVSATGIPACVDFRPLRTHTGMNACVTSLSPQGLTAFAALVLLWQIASHVLAGVRAEVRYFVCLALVPVGASGIALWGGRRVVADPAMLWPLAEVAGIALAALLGGAVVAKWPRTLQWTLAAVLIALAASQTISLRRHAKPVLWRAA